MVRTYHRKQPTKHTSEQLLYAIEAVNKKMKVPMAAQKYNVPVSTLYDHSKGRVAKIGPGTPTVLSDFLKCGLCPLSREAIPSHKLSKDNLHKSLSLSTDTYV